MDISENEFRDLLYDNHKDDLLSLVRGRRDPVEWNEDGVPPIRFFLQQMAEIKINELIDGLETLVITARELRLVKSEDSTTRIDLYGNSEANGITIIELKKSKQTERQAFTELLGYANHFCSIFPGATETAFNPILIAPMENRIVRDAYVQELLANNKNILAFVPSIEGDEISLSVYYPDDSYYKWFENNLLDDASMSVVAISFPIIEGWIDTDCDETEGRIPDHSKSALNTISNTISHRLESENIHSFVYASQKWGEIADIFPYPNTIFVVGINPFTSYRTFVEDNKVSGNSKEGRLEEIQRLYDQFNEEDRDEWIEFLESNFRGLLIKIVKEEFDRCFTISGGKQGIISEISLPDWYGIKTSMIDAVTTHNLDVFPTGLLRKIYTHYLEYIYVKEDDPLYFSDDIPKYAYEAHRHYLAIWEILRGIGLGDIHA